MPAPGPAAPWQIFFPHDGEGALAALLRDRFDAYRQSVRAQLQAPSFGRVDRLVVLADVLAALHAGPMAFADTAAALGAVARALRWRNPLLGRLAEFLPSWLAVGGGIRRVAFAASKSDHVAERQRGNLAALVRRLTEVADHAETAAFAIAAVRCTEDFVWTLEGRNVSAVRGRVLGDERLTRSYPGEVPDRMPEPGFWSHAFLALPVFEPRRLPKWRARRRRPDRPRRAAGVPAGGRAVTTVIEKDTLPLPRIEIEDEAAPGWMPGCRSCCATPPGAERGTLRLVLAGAGRAGPGVRGARLREFRAGPVRPVSRR